MLTKKEAKIKEALSIALYSIEDMALQNVVRKIIFSNPISCVNWNKVGIILKREMPEIKYTDYK